MNFIRNIFIIFFVFILVYFVRSKMQSDTKLKNFKKGTIRNLYNMFQKKFKSNNITFLKSDPIGLLIGTSDGLAIKNLNNFEWLKSRNDENRDKKSKYILSNNFINSVYRYGKKLYICTMDGLNIYDTDKNKNKIVNFNFNGKDVKCINTVVKEASYLWIGTCGYGLIKYNPNNGKYIFYNEETKGRKGFKNFNITSFSRNFSGNLLFSTFENGYSKFSNIIRMNKVGKKGTKLTSNRINKIKKSNKRLYILTSDGLHIKKGLFYTKLKKLADNSTEKATNLNLPSNNILDVQQNDKDIYIATDKGLYIKKDKENKTIFKDVRITCLLDYMGRLFIGTYGKGLYSLEI